MPENRELGVNTCLDVVPYSAFEEIERSIALRGDPDFIRLHQGKTSFPPCVQPGEWSRAEFELLAHEHAPPAGSAALRRQIVKYLGRDDCRQVTEDQIVVTCGATHAIGMALNSVLDPGDEVLLLSPQWLFAAGLVHAARGRPVEVPVFLELDRDSGFDFVAALEAHRTERTKALYFNSPNNPTGHSMDPSAHDALAKFSARHDLWIIADNAYELYDFEAHGFIDIGGFAQATDRTFSVYSFSKTYAMPGHRAGFLVVPEAMADRMRKWALYSVYSVSTASQFAAIQALATADSVLDGRREEVRQARDIVQDRLTIPHTTIDGGLYTFLDLSGWNKGSPAEFLAASMREGVSLAPGQAFGRHCSGYARLCFTAADIDSLEVAVERLNRAWHR